MSTRHLIYASTLLIMSTVWFAAGAVLGGFVCAALCAGVVFAPPRWFPGEYSELNEEVERLRDDKHARTQWLDQAKRDAGYSTNVSFDIVWDDALRALKDSRLAREVPSDCYVQPVPDHCDRITWRGHYYGLPPCNPLQNPTSGGPRS